MSGGIGADGVGVVTGRGLIIDAGVGHRFVVRPDNQAREASRSAAVLRRGGERGRGGEKKKKKNARPTPPPPPRERRTRRQKVLSTKTPPHRVWGLKNFIATPLVL